jgi:hypothetical protein
MPIVIGIRRSFNRTATSPYLVAALAEIDSLLRAGDVAATGVSHGRCPTEFIYVSRFSSASMRDTRVTVQFIQANAVL